MTSEPYTDMFPVCHCASDNTGQVCNMDHMAYPPTYQVVTDDRVLDISTEPEEKYYLNTFDMYRLNRLVC